MDEFERVQQEILGLINEWESKLLVLNNTQITKVRNGQNRTIKQIMGHLVDSVTNNTHRMIHLQYQKSPCNYPDYANLGNNDRWIAVQNYNEEEWYDLVQLWKYSNLHIIHVIQNINSQYLQNEWISALNEKITLQNMVIDYPLHMKLHFSEISELIEVQ